MRFVSFAIYASFPRLLRPHALAHSFPNSSPNNNIAPNTGAFVSLAAIPDVVAADEPSRTLSADKCAVTYDLVTMRGYRGSVLRSAEAPNRQLWVPVKVGINVRKVNLELGLDPEDEESAQGAVIPSGMLKNIEPVDKSRKLFKRIRECDNVRTERLRVHDYGYDWRLGPHILSKKLVNFLKALPSN